MEGKIGSRRVLIALAGGAGFGILMAFRGEASGVAVRALLAALAFAWGALAVRWLMRRA
jgi:hypothetical protein